MSDKLTVGRVVLSHSGTGYCGCSVPCPPPRERTHWDTCWQSHLPCAIAHAERLIAEGKRIQRDLAGVVKGMERLLRGRKK